MSEDEAFIRAIVDSPGDDTVRLVYADWLDERDDPRGAYMRAEREAVVSGDVEKLREMAVGLDPVWVARVSLPPVGVCCDHIAFTHRGPVVTTRDIAEVEQRLELTFPDDYKGFLLNYNGGCVDASIYDVELQSGETLGWPDLWWRFDPLHEVHQRVMRPDDYLQRDAAEPDERSRIEAWLSRFVFVGRNPDMIGAILLGVRDRDRGDVRIVDTSVELEAAYRAYQWGHPPEAPTVAEFLFTIR